jgi:Lrp/AsnC family leucine-responsive transcriptional regulator
MLDAVDRRLITLLQTNARMSNAEIARRLQMAPSATYERTRKLEDRGVVHRYEARVAPEEVDLGMVAFLFVRSSGKPGELETGEDLARIPNVQEVHHVAGEDCFLAKVRVRDAQDLSRLMREQIGKIDSVQSTRTTIVLETIKETAALPVDQYP